MENRILDKNDMFQRSDIRSIFHVTDDQILQWEKEGLITPRYIEGRAYYNPTKVAVIAGNGRKRGALKAEFR